MSDTNDNIVTLRPNAAFPIHKRQKPRCNCSDVGEKYSLGQTPHVWVDEATRDLECQRCGARIEAFDYMWTLASEGESLTRELQRMRDEKQALGAQCTLLNDQIRELRGVVRKLEKSK
jgi:hypothetical protein